MPDAFMIAPDSMNSGIAISGKLVAPLYIVIATLGSIAVPCVATNATTATTPSETAIGMSINTKASTAPNSKQYLHQRQLSLIKRSSVQTLGKVACLYLF